MAGHRPRLPDERNDVDRRHRVAGDRPVGAAGALDRPLRSARAEHPRIAPAVFRAALARHRLLRPRYPVAHPVRRAAFAADRAAVDPAGSGGRHADRAGFRLFRRQARHRDHAGDGRDPGVPVTDPGTDPGRHAGGQRHQPDPRHRLHGDPGLRPHRAGADDRLAGAGVRPGRAGAGLFRQQDHVPPPAAQHRPRRAGDGVALDGDRRPGRSLARLHRPQRRTADSYLGRHGARGLREHPGQLRAGPVPQPRGADPGAGAST